MRRRILVLPILALAVPGLAMAAGGTSAPMVSTASAGMKVKGAKPASRPVPPFKKVDTNGDHRIEWKEAKAVGVPKAVFHRFDYHHDGKLTMTEWKLVDVAMVQTRALPRPESSSMPPVPASVAKSVRAPRFGTASRAVAGTAPKPMSAPAPATSGRPGG